MPPTLAAARKITCGRFLANQSNTAAWSRRSSSPRPMVRSSILSRASRRASALPTIPRCPATKTVLPCSSNGVLAIGHLPPRDLEIAGHHLAHELRKAGLRLPAELLANLAGVADQEVDFGRPEIGRIDPHDGLAGLAIDADFFDALAAPFDGAANFRECQFDEFANRAGLSRRQHEIVGGVGLQDHMHALDIVPGMTPVALGFEVAEIECLVEPDLDARHPAGDLARHESLTADRTLVVEQDSVRREDAVGLAIVHRDPVAVELGDAVWRARIEWCGFLLRDLLNQPVQLRGRCLIEPRLLLHAEDSDRLE